MNAVLSKAATLIKNGEVEKAWSILESLPPHKLHDPEVANAVGVMRALSGRYHEAAGLFEMSLRTSRNKAKALCNLGNLCLLQDDPEGALRYYAKAMEASFVSPEPRYNAARAYQEMGHFEKAMQAILDYDECRHFQKRLGLVGLLTALMALAYLMALLCR